ncbi:ARM repeat-containing protein [Rhizoclosmatium globosum]|uniref:ARM repeat-containing protein n=1 Tax=Rhizoclosmatium globosum TaxID=329046 RepID=A0A1Y2BZB8_9FUNG|nr:ARM repeat-containing protein [Rhizoclosmatium globosum]|eukprot:ORY39415.1 ARM repeat-containing protein [Rhizoclosmatium globosum]
MEQQYTVATVLQGITTLYSSTSTAADKKEADRWLRDFQRSVAAWAIAESLLKAEAMPFEAALFAAQTMRQKVRYDAAQLESPAQRLGLRDVLLSLLAVKYRRGPRAVVAQLSVAVAAVAVHAKEWSDPVASLFDLFSANKQDWLLLVDILAALPYEFEDGATDSSFFLNKDEATNRTKEVVYANSNKVLHALVMMLEQCDPLNGDADLVKLILECLRSWLIAGDVSLDKIAGTNIVPRCFSFITVPTSDALDDAVFETAVDVLVEIIRSSGKKLSAGRDNATTIPLVESIYNGLMSLAPSLNSVISRQEEEETRVREFCRLFVYAGESYMSHILSSPESWTPIAEAILVCTAIKDLEIVGITFHFWIVLAEEITAKTESGETVLQPKYQSSFLDIYRRLNAVMIRHLHYPSDSSSTWTAKERDEFRDFRHNMGDVLKHCVYVLGQQEALATPYTILQSFQLAGAPGGTLDPATPWQQIEAPLFALRTIGRNISDNESTVLPVIMGMLPQLPNHPKIKYAAILVIGRYASWTKLHPEFLSYQMTFIAKGFEENEAIGAASQSLRYLCDECGDQLVGYLSQLHPFYMSIGNVLNSTDKADVIAGLANVIKHVPVESTGDMPDMLKVLEMFCLPIAQRLHEIGKMAVAPEGGYSPDLQLEVFDLVDQFTTFMYNAQPVLPANNPSIRHPCTVLLTNMWPVLEALLYLRDPKIINTVCRLLVKCVDTQKQHFRPLVGPVLEALATVYEVTKISSAMWPASKIIGQFGGEDGAVVHSLVGRMSAVAFRAIQECDGQIDIVSDGLY